MSRFQAWVSERPFRLKAYVLGKAAAVVVMLILIWALQDKDAVVVYMNF